MNYESFRAAFEHALKESKLRMMGLWGEESLDTRSLDRTYEVHVEPLGGQDAEPFFVAASISFRWDALSTARTATREEDTLMELYGPDGIPKRKTTRPYHRIDIKLNASLMDGKELPLPSSRAWAAWGEETMGRLEDIEPLTPVEKVRKNKAGNLEVLAWHGEPEATILVAPGGDLRLRAVSISGFQLMETPRAFDDLDKEDPGPYDDLREMFHRVRASLLAWMQALSHLKKVAPSRPDDPLRH
jgi:hypothetical protein